MVRRFYKQKERNCGKIIPQGELNAYFRNKNGYGDMVLMSMETYEKNLFLTNIYGKLEEAKEDMRNGRYSSVEDAISRIRKTHGL